jgi:hypothetical protein
VLSRAKSTRKTLYYLTVSLVQWLVFLATDPEVRVLFLALPDFLRSSESGTQSAQHREHN